MLTLAEIKGSLRAGPYAWPGGYPLYFLTCDGEALSFIAVRECWRNIVYAHLTNNTRDEWAICAVDINYEDADLYCAHTNERIESAYAD